MRAMAWASDSSKAQSATGSPRRRSRVMRIRRSTLASRCPEVSAVVGSGETTVVRWPWASNRTVVRKTKSSTSGENRMTWASEGGAGGVAGRRKTLTSASSSPGRTPGGSPASPAVRCDGCRSRRVPASSRVRRRPPAPPNARRPAATQRLLGPRRGCVRASTRPQRRLAPSPGLTSALGRASTRRATVTERRRGVRRSACRRFWPSGSSRYGSSGRPSGTPAWRRTRRRRRRRRRASVPCTGRSGAATGRRAWGWAGPVRRRRRPLLD